MKKFLKKLPVMVTLVVLAVAILALNIGMLARPVSYGMSYKGKATAGDKTITTTYTFKNDKVVKVKQTEGEKTLEYEQWIVRKGNEIVMVPMGFKTLPSGNNQGVELMTEEAYNTLAKTYENETIWKGAVKAGGAKINAYKITSEYNDDSSMINGGAIAYTVVMGLVEIALITFAVLSVVAYTSKGGKKTSKKKSK